MPKKRSVKIERARHGKGFTVRAYDPKKETSWDLGYAGNKKQAQEIKKQHKWRK